MYKIGRKPSYCAPECCSYPENPCSACADVMGKVEICGDGVRAALAEIFMVGGCVDLQLQIEVDATCGHVDRIVLRAKGDAVADMT